MKRRKRTMMEKGKVAFLVYHSHCNLTTWLNGPAEVWMRNGYVVDVITIASEMHSKFGFRGLNGRSYETSLAGLPSLPRGLRMLWSYMAYVVCAFRISKQKRYCCLIGFDPRGIIPAGCIGLWLQIPFIFQSLELTVSTEINLIKRPALRFGQRVFKAIERMVSKKASMVVIQDENRAGILAKDNGIPRAKFQIVPNSTFGPTNHLKSSYLKERLGIEESKKIVLFCGSINENQVGDGLLTSIPAWPDDCVFVLHGWGNPRHKEKLLKVAEDYKGRVFFSFDLIPYDRVDLVFRSADVGVALYRSNSFNVKYVGCAAGKVFNFLKHGVPCIASDLPGLRDLIEGNQCGVCINGYPSLGIALRSVFRNYPVLSRNALQAFNRYEFGKYYQKVINRFEAMGRVVNY